MITLSCPSCQKKLNVKDQLAGKKVRCPHCKQTTDIPAGTVAIEPAKPSFAEDATVPPSAASFNEEATVPPKPSVLADTVLAKAEHNGDVDSEKEGEDVAAEAHYKMEGEIARGGMGAIMRAIDQDIRREVAVKFLLNHADDKMKARFVEEAQITGQLEHPNIVPIHQLGVHEDGRCFFSMKMVKGHSLAEILKDKKSKYTLGRLLNIFVSICNAMAYAHSREVIHRDLKPANVMVGDFGEVYVMDWGLAKVLGKDDPPVSAASSTHIKAKKSSCESTQSASSSSAPATKQQRKKSAADSNQPEDASHSKSGGKITINRQTVGELTQAGAIMGTPAYMPPEQAKCEDVDQRADIYSLGAILYEIMTLTPPVGRGGDMLGILMRVVEGKIDPPQKRSAERAKAGWMPSELSAIAMKALATDAADRYQTVEALRRDVELFLEGRSVSAKQDSFHEMAVKLVKRNKGVSITAAAALVVLVVVAGFFLKINYDARVLAEANYAAYLKEQDEKRLRTKKSAPAFFRAAQLMTNEKNFDDALAQVTIALDADPGLTDAYLLKGQLLIGLEHFAEAEAPLRAFLERKPDDALAAKLADLAARPEPDKAAYFWSLWEVFDKQKNLPLAERMTHMAERGAGPGKDLLVLYRRRIEAVPGWAGLGNKLSLDKNGNLHLYFQGLNQVRDLSALKGMKLSSLSLNLTQVEDLAPLEGMPLTRLDLRENHLDLRKSQVKDLRPLRGMTLNSLSLQGLAKITDLEPLRGMPLTDLNIAFCHGITDLEPLRGMPLTQLYCNSYGAMKIRNLEPLTGMKLKTLSLGGARLVKDIGPLRDMPLEWLSLGGLGDLRDFEPLRGRPLAYLDLNTCAIRNLDVLKDMPLTSLDLKYCGNVEDLTPLAGMKLTFLNLERLTKVQDLQVLQGMPLIELSLDRCEKVPDFEVLKDLPLTTLRLADCPQLKDLEFLRGISQLGKLSILRCKQLRDLGPLKGMKLKVVHLTPAFIDPQSMELLRGMNLDRIWVDETRNFDGADFWKKYDAGEFKK